jgi:hypothetical protein
MEKVYQKKFMEKRVLCVAAAALFLLCFGAMSFSGALKTGGAENLSLNLGEALKPYYVTGELFTPPPAEITYGDETKPAVAALRYPDGLAYERQEYTLTIAGEYTIEYAARFGAKRRTVLKTFTVRDALYSFFGGGDPSSAEYREYKTGSFGLSVGLSRGQSIRFNEPLDVRNLSSSDTVANLFIDPAEFQKADFTRLFITLTDAYDSDIYVTMSVRYNPTSSETSEIWSYALASAYGQRMRGFYNDIYYVEPSWGVPYQTSFFGPSGGKPADSEQISMSMDTQNNIVFFNGRQVIDLMTPAPVFLRPFKGFPSGLAFVSLRADEYVGQTARFVITKIGNTELSREVAIDESEPEITVDYLGNSRVPNAKTGLPFRIFPASATERVFNSPDGKISRINAPVKRAVYSNYGLPTAANVNIEDGMFTPKTPGVYTIVYTAAGRSGKPATETVQVTALADLPKVQVAIECNRIVSGVVGQRIPIAKCTVAGGTGIISVEARVNGASGNLSPGGYFIPMNAGAYTVAYVACDYIGQRSMSYYNVNIRQGDRPVFTTEPNLPRYLIKGATHSLPVPEAVDYTGGAAAVSDVAVSVKAGAVERRAGANGKIKMDFDAETVTVVYRAGAAELTYDIPLINVKKPNGDLDLVKYFISDTGVSPSSESGGIAFTTSDGGGFKFIRELLADGLDIRFNAVTAKSAYQRVNLYMTDSINPSQEIKVSYGVADNGFYINGQLIRNLQSSFTDTVASNEFFLRYLPNEGGFKAVADAAAFMPSHTVSGEAFTGFASNVVYVRAEFEGVRGESQILMRSINGQALSGEVAVNNLRPTIALLDDAGGTYEIGDTIPVSRAVALDVLDPDVELVVTVIGNGGFVQSVEGVVLNNVPAGVGVRYRIAAADYDTFIVRYTAKNSDNGIPVSKSYTIYIPDRTPPVITVDGAIPATAKLGAAVTIPAASAVDNADAVPTVSVILIDPSGKLNVLSVNQTSFTVMMRGSYTIRYHCLDSAGNAAIKDFEIKVTEE